MSARPKRFCNEHGDLDFDEIAAELVWNYGNPIDGQGRESPSFVLNDNIEHFALY